MGSIEHRLVPLEPKTHLHLMSSQKQLAANASNALLSTGPRTSEGRAVVSRNALKHGLSSPQVLGAANLLPHESAADFNRLREGLWAHLCPMNAMEEALVERIVSVTWRLRRLEGIEAGLMTHHLWRVIHERASKQEQGIDPFSINPGRRRMLNGDTPPPSMEERISQGVAKSEGREKKEDAEEVLQGDSAMLGEAFARMLGKDALGKLSRYESNLKRFSIEVRVVGARFPRPSSRARGRGNLAPTTPVGYRFIWKAL